MARCRAVRRCRSSGSCQMKTSTASRSGSASCEGIEFVTGVRVGHRTGLAGGVNRHRPAVLEVRSMIMNAMLRVALVFWGTLLLILFAPLSSRAAVTEEGAPNIMVRPFDGPKAKA